MRIARYHACMTKDCDEPAIYWVRLEAENRNKHVCGNCRDELVGAFGWVLFNW